MDKRNCTNCFHAHVTDPQPGQPLTIGQREYQCRAHPPTANVLPTGNGGLAMVSVWPNVTDQMRCGVYQPLRHLLDAVPPVKN